MPTYYDRYRQGLYQETYDELLSMQEHVYNASVYDDALLVMREIMQRVRYNVEMLVSRLSEMKYQFWDGVNAQPRAATDRNLPAFRLLTSKDLEQLSILEGLLKEPLPLSLKCWFEEVGQVNFIGFFQNSTPVFGPGLDPLHIWPIETLVQIVTSFSEMGMLSSEEGLLLSPDSYHKYGYSGGGAYTLLFPCRAIDAPLLNEPHNATFVNYLRICMRWGGFPGLAQKNMLSQEAFDFLTKDLIPF